MDKAEALAVLESELGRYRSRPYADLLELLDSSTRSDVRGPSGATYQVQLQVFWDRHPGGSLRVLGCIDDGGWRALKPLTAAFLLAPDGSFVDE